MKRSHISWKTKCASALLALGDISYEDSKSMNADQVCSLYQFDHDPIRHADGGSDHPSNLTPRLIADHRSKTRRDTKDMAKERKIRRAADEHAVRMLFKAAGNKPERRSRWPKRPFPKRRKPR